MARRSRMAAAAVVLALGVGSAGAERVTISIPNGISPGDRVQINIVSLQDPGRRQLIDLTSDFSLSRSEEEAVEEAQRGGNRTGSRMSYYFLLSRIPIPQAILALLRAVPSMSLTCRPGPTRFT